MIKTLLCAATALSMAAAPCAAAGFREIQDPGERRSGAVAGLYLSLPLGGERSGRPQAGLRLQMAHDYRSASTPRARVVEADVLDLRLAGDRLPTLYVASRPVTGADARKQKLVGGGGIVTVAILAAAAVGVYFIVNEIDGDDDDCDDASGCD